MTQTSLDEFKATSKESFKQVNIIRTQKLVMEQFKNHPFLTRRELVLLTGLAMCSVTGRVNELINEKGFLETAGTKWDETTKRNVELITTTQAGKTFNQNEKSI